MFSMKKSLLDLLFRRRRREEARKRLTPEVWRGSGQKKSEADRRRRAKVESLRARLLQGDELSAQELEYLRRGPKQLYKEAVQAAAARKDFRNQLLRVKSREEAVSTRFRISASVRSQSALPLSEGGKILVAALDNEWERFSKYLDALPPDRNGIPKDRLI